MQVLDADTVRGSAHAQRIDRLLEACLFGGNGT